MENHLNDKEFERLLRENADRYRMYPSERVWKNVHTALHPNQRRFRYTVTAIILSAVLILSSDVYFSRTSNSGNQILSENHAQPVADNSAIISENTKSNITRTDNQSSSQVPVFKKRTFTLKREIVIPSLTVSDILTNNTNTEEVIIIPVEQFITENNAVQSYESETFDGLKIPSNESFALHEYKPAVIGTDGKAVKNNTVMDEKTQRKVNETIMALASQNIRVNSFKKQRRVSTQFYLTPTVSYRKMIDEGNASNGYLAWQLTQSNNVNHIVKHKPAAGFDFGFETRYGLTSKMFIKAGLQFNINRYDIRAYYHPAEIATVAVNNGFNRVNYAAISNYRNSDGYLTRWLENKYFQVALPVGADLLLSSNKNFKWGISGSLQPTYLLGNGAYLISSNYKNYAKFPELMRRWNVNTEAGTFIGYSTGGIKWQMGPNIRYQLLSSYVEGYPVKENLFAVGFKVGASFQKQK